MPAWQTHQAVVGATPLRLDSTSPTGARLITVHVLSGTYAGSIVIGPSSSVAPDTGEQVHRGERHSLALRGGAQLWARAGTGGSFRVAVTERDSIPNFA